MTGWIERKYVALGNLHQDLESVLDALPSASLLQMVPNFLDGRVIRLGDTLAFQLVLSEAHQGVRHLREGFVFSPSRVEADCEAFLCQNQHVRTLWRDCLSVEFQTRQAADAFDQASRWTKLLAV